MSKETYVHENEQFKIRESYDIKVTDEGVDYIIIEDSNGNIVQPTWHLIETLYKNIKRQLDYFEDCKRDSEEE